MSESKKNKSNEYTKKHSDDYVPHTSKGGSKGYIKRDHGPAKHHIPYGRHKVEENLVDKDLVDQVINEIHEEQQ